MSSNKGQFIWILSSVGVGSCRFLGNSISSRDLATLLTLWPDVFIWFLYSIFQQWAFIMLSGLFFIMDWASWPSEHPCSFLSIEKFLSESSALEVHYVYSISLFCTWHLSEFSQFSTSWLVSWRLSYSWALVWSRKSVSTHCILHHKVTLGSPNASQSSVVNTWL